MIKKIKQLLFPRYTDWRILCISKTGYRYRVIQTRQNKKSGKLHFKSILIGEIDEEPSIKHLQDTLNKFNNDRLSDKTNSDGNRLSIKNRIAS